MARRYERNMIRIVFVYIGLLLVSNGYAQENTYLSKLADDLKLIRQEKYSEDLLAKTVIEWSAAKCPKITLMDEIKSDYENEYRGNGANKFRVNQLVAYVYKRQNVGMVSKGDYFNSTESDIYYSAIEKTIKKGKSVTYTLTNHIGDQEFIIMSYNPNTNYKAFVNGKKAIQKEKGIHHISIRKVNRADIITISIVCAPSNKASFESFVILNHNPQR